MNGQFHRLPLFRVVSIQLEALATVEYSCGQSDAVLLSIALESRSASAWRACAPATAFAWEAAFSASSQARWWGM